MRTICACYRLKLLESGNNDVEARKSFCLALHRRTSLLSACSKFQLLQGPNAREGYDFAPLLNFASNERGKVSGRAGKYNRTHGSEACLDRCISKARFDFVVKSGDDLAGCV